MISRLLLASRAFVSILLHNEIPADSPPRREPVNPSNSSPHTRPNSRKYTLNPAVLLLLAFPFALVSANSNWLYSPLGWVDQWVYFGYFLHLQPFKADLFPNLYYGTRLPWILPGYVVHRLFDVMTAKYVLHFGFYYLAVFPMYCLLKRAAGRRTALLGAVLFATHAAFLLAIGWDYMDGAGITYNLLGLASMARGASSKQPWPWIALAGAAGAAMVYTNLFLICFMPCVFVFYLFLRYKPDQPGKLRLLLTSGLWFGAGAAVLTIALGVINDSLDGNFWFYGPSIVAFIGLAAHPNPWRANGLGWLRTAYWLGIPVVTGACGLLYLALRIQRRLMHWGDSCTAFVSLYHVELIGMIVWYWISGVGLQLNFYVSYLLPLMFLAIGCMLVTALDEWRAWVYWLLILGTAGMFAFSLNLADGTFASRLHHAGLAVIVLCPMVGLCLTVVFYRRQPVILAALAGLWLYQVGYSGMAAPNPHNRQTFLRTVRASNIVWSHIQEERRPVLFWYGSKEPGTMEFMSLNSIFLYEYSMLSTDFPSTGPRLQPGGIAVILSDHPGVLGEADRALAPLQMKTEVLAENDIASDGVSYRMTFVRFAEPTPEHLQPLAVSMVDGVAKLTLATPAEPRELPQDKWSSVQVRSDGLFTTMAQQRYTWGPRYVPLVASRSGLYRFTLKYKVIEGGLLFGGMATDMTRALGRSPIPRPTGQTQTVVYSQQLTAGEGVVLLIANDPPGPPRATSCLIESLEASAKFDEDSSTSVKRNPGAVRR